MRRRLLFRTTLFAVVVAAAVSVAVALARRGDGDSAAPTVAAIGVQAAEEELLRVQRAPAGPQDNCPKARRSKPRPPDFPAKLPLPSGTVLTEIRRYEPRGFPSFVYVIGFAPLTLQDAARFFAIELPRSGYDITSSEAEDLAVEGRFGGAASGAFKAASLVRCSRYVWMIVGVSKPKSQAPAG